VRDSSDVKFVGNMFLILARKKNPARDSCNFVLDAAFAFVHSAGVAEGGREVRSSTPEKNPTSKEIRNGISQR
jgi:hypothetical protein